MEAIEVRNLWFGYPESNYIFKNTNFSIGKGEVCGLTGKSGSGKTTLLKICAALYPLKGWFFKTKGEIIIDQKLRLSKATKREILEYHSRSGFVFQGSALISNMNAIQNLTLPLIYHRKMHPDEAEQIASRLLKQTGLSEDDFYHRPAQMSIGERKLVAVLRAIITEPEFLFLDEPTAELDPSTSQIVKTILISYINRKKPTTLIASNSTDIIKNLTNRVFFIEDQSITETTPEEANRKLIEIQIENIEGENLTCTY